MNILIPHSWLLDHLDTDATPQEIQELLSLAGPSVERIVEREGESIYDIEVTTNRVDALSVRGIAREAAVILKHLGKKASLRPLHLNSPHPSEPQLPLPKITNDPLLSGRVICIALANVEQTPTPEWMAKRLRIIDLNVHNSAIDITNYVTHDLGHPCHAFDYDKLMAKGGEINIVDAHPNEHFITLDGLDFATVGGEVVFKNGAGEIIDLPSIKGTANTSVDDSTTNILLLMESIRADKVRFASMTHNIRTTAAQLMEKHVDPYLAQSVLFKASQQYLELCSARIASEMYDDFPAEKPSTPIIFPLHSLKRYLGIDIPIVAVTTILTDLGCQVTHEDDEHLKIIPPTYRSDLVINADIVEEVARIYGYHNLPSQLMTSALPLNPPEHRSFQLEKKIKISLSNLGWQEMYTYSLVSESLALQSGYPVNDHLRLQNPLSDDRVFLRRLLTPSLIEAVEANPLTTQLSVYEIAHVYNPTPTDLPDEVLHLTLVSRRSYREVRGYLETLFDQLYIPSSSVDIIAIDQDSIYSQKIVTPEGTLQIGQILYKDGDRSLTLGTVITMSGNLIVIDIEIDLLNSIAQTHPIYIPIPKTNPLVEDLTFTFPSQTPMGEVIAQMKSEITELDKIELKSNFQNNVTFTLWYFDAKNNMSNERVEPLRKQLVTAVEKKWQASLVGTI